MLTFIYSKTEGFMQKTKYSTRKNKPLIVKEPALADYATFQHTLNNNLKGVRKNYGMFFTPERIVDFMVNLIDIRKHTGKNNLAILEPACGLAQFLIGIKRNLPALSKKASLKGIEINSDVINYLTTLNIDNNIRIIHDDYLMWKTSSSFDLVIGNPPYGIPSPSEHYSIRIDSATKERYKTLYETWYGKYNVYGAFIEKSIKLLKENGQLIFIVPATFMILDEFRKLRNFLSRHGGTAIIYLGPDVFRPEANVSSVVLNFIKDRKFTSRLELMAYSNNKFQNIKINPDWQGETVKFETGYTQTLEKMCSYRLGDIYEIKISPRTPEIKHSHYITKEKPVRKTDNFLPVLNGRNLKCNEIIYDGITGYWINKSHLENFRGYFDVPHIVVGLGFRENGRIGASYDEKHYPWMGDVYHLLKKTNLFSNNNLSNLQVVEYLNSDFIRKYVKDVYKEITYHLSITQLKNLPLPNEKEWEEIKRDIP